MRTEPRQAGNAAACFEQACGSERDALARAARAQQQGQQLDVSQGLHAKGERVFSRIGHVGALSNATTLPTFGAAPIAAFALALASASLVLARLFDAHDVARREQGA